MSARLRLAVPVLSLALSVPATRPADPLPEARPNDNRKPAGRLSRGILTLRLQAQPARWTPDDAAAPGIPIFVFAEVGKAPSAPGPMIRVPAGTEIRASVRNALPVPMRLRGLQDRSSAGLDSTVIAPGATQLFRFRADVPGTYYYWARTAPPPPLPVPGVGSDALLVGAFIVDPAGTEPPKDERVLLISIWSDTLAALGKMSDDAYRIMRRELIPRDQWLVGAVNGRSWPQTERLSYRLGDTVRWRVINGSGIPHPMHLHGFYFDVTARGDAQRDTVFTAAQRRMAVTEWMSPGTTMSMSWTPTRPGNWLFHCHIVQHMAATRGAAPHYASGAGHAMHNMSGLVVGIRVAPGRRAAPAPEAAPGERKRLRVFVTERANVYGAEPAYSYVLQQGARAPAADSIISPSSTILLRRNEPTEITVVNLARHLATIHWHGIELESYYDGVGGWSGWDAQVAPQIAPGDSFVVRLTPHRAGTFIYHTHVEEAIQLPSGLYGMLIVLPENATPDTTERTFLIGMGSPADDGRTAINGLAAPPPVEVRAGTGHRFRFINISPLESHTVQLLRAGELQQWRALAKDGADLPPSQAVEKPAILVLHPGETYDFEVLRARPDSLVLKISSPETIEKRLAFRARGVVREALPRLITEIPVIVH